MGYRFIFRILFRRHRRRNYGTYGTTMPKNNTEVFEVDEMMKMPENKDVTVKYKDPVCGMWVSSQEAAAAIDYSGATYYFCSQGCAQSFQKNPAGHVKSVGHESMNVNMDMQGHGHKGHGGHKHGCGC